MAHLQDLVKTLSPAMKHTLLVMTGAESWVTDLRTAKALDRRGLTEATNFFKCRLTPLGRQVKQFLEELE